VAFQRLRDLRALFASLPALRRDLAEHGVVPPRLRARVLDRLVHGYTRARYLFPTGELALGAVHVTKDVVYGPLRTHRMDVYRPANSQADAARVEKPPVVYVHGGGFQMLSKETHRAMALRYARAGYTVFVPDYRLAPEHPAPAQLEDAIRAITFAVGGDAPKPFLLAGESAGGNLVTALALLASRRDQKAEFAEFFEGVGRGLVGVVATYGLLDLTDRCASLARPKIKPYARRMAHRSAQAYALGRYPRGLAEVTEKIAEYPFLSPLTWLEDGYVAERPLPPFFIDCGTRDPLLNQSRRLAKALQEAATSAELLVVPGGIHAYDALGTPAQQLQKWEAVTRFLDRLDVAAISAGRHAR
jgi:acetyl esterase/lipase